MDIRYRDRAKLKAKVKKRASIIMALYNGDMEEAIKLAKQWDIADGEMDEMLELVCENDVNTAIVEISPKEYARKICREWGMDGISTYKEVVNMLDRYFPEMDSIINKSEQR